MSKAETAIRLWKEKLPATQVIDEPDTLGKALSDVAEYPPRTSPAILHATSVADVQKIIQIANQTLVPVYPSSTGRNWGFGSRKPVRDGCAVIDLSGMIVTENDCVHFYLVRYGLGTTGDMGRVAVIRRRPTGHDSRWTAKAGPIVQDRPSIPDRKDVRRGASPDTVKEMGGATGHRAPRRAIVVQDSTVVPRGEDIGRGAPPNTVEVF